MKKILFGIFLFQSIQAFACVCDYPNLTEKYIRADFVASITIKKIYLNKTDEMGYKADIQIDELFKGDALKSIYVYGRSSDEEIGSSCDIFIPENTKLVAYAYKNKDGNYGVGMCSGLAYLDNRYIKQEKRELEILRILKSKGVDYTDKVYYMEKGTTLNDSLQQFKGIELDKKYGIYEITFSSDLKIKNIRIVSGFEAPIDEKLIDILWKTEWKTFSEKDKVKENSKILLGIYNYESEKEHPSFLSQYFF
ncbi:MAG TPA: hypothetical protein VEV16_02025 [Daejeonella sp.]|nr:hypothetical protein [Daejeonella sp.]